MKGATGPVVGARFKGANSNGTRSWSTEARVTVCDPVQALSFDVKAGGLAVATWSYTIEAGPGSGCVVTESWTDRRGMIVRVLGRAISGVDDRASFSRQSMETTLANLAAAAET